MGLAHSPRIATDGLVFVYDMGNPQKSWKGAPTTNLATTQTLVNHSLVTLPTFSDAPEKGIGWKKAIVTATSSNFRMLRMDAFNVSANSTHTYSIEFECNSPEVYLNIDGTGFGGGPWTKIGPTRYSRTVTTATAGQAYLFVCSNNLSASVNYIIYYKEHQIENNLFATPFVSGTRSNTQAILDLTNNNTVTATSLTYASNNTFNFNGSNSLTVPYNPSLFTFNNEQTIIIWMKNEASVAARRNPYNQAYGGGGTITHENNTFFNYIYGTSGVDNVPYTNHASPFSVVLNETAQIAITRNVSQTAWYKNGALGNTLANPYGATVVTGTSPILLGTGYTNGVVGGLYAVQIYNRALSASEIQQNFNALRGRYGI